MKQLIQKQQKYKEAVATLRKAIAERWPAGSRVRVQTRAGCERTPGTVVSNQYCRPDAVRVRLDTPKKIVRDFNFELVEDAGSKYSEDE